MRNIDLAKDNLADGKFNDVSYQTFSHMASFYGRFMEPHRHDGYYQIHYLDHGFINLSLDDRSNLTPVAPLFILTPPSIPHAFYSTNDTTGFVLTVRDSLVNQVLLDIYPTDHKIMQTKAMCVSLKDHLEIKENLEHFFALIASAVQGSDHNMIAMMQYLIKAFFTYLYTVCKDQECITTKVKGELALFQEFKRLIEENFTKQLTVPAYAKIMGITDSRLKDMCRRFGGVPPKRMIFERVLVEAKRQLLFQDISINQIANNLGFTDPSYFARFFTRHAGISPSQWLNNAKNAQVWK